jgi:Protein of unknown function (DUF1186)/SEC-C motif
MTKNSRSRDSADFPVAIVAPYGPDNTRATKLVVSIFPRPEDRDPLATRIWTTEAADVRSEPTISPEVAAFVSSYRVKRTANADRIIGCPHEEGIDYPMGRTCPQCPFWAGIDRFTHEPISVPVSSMSAEDVLSTLAEDPLNTFEAALASADAHREALVDRLLEALERGVADPSGASKQAASLFSYALYLLARWREPRAYPYVVRWLSLAEEEPFEIAGDIVTQDGARILAAVCDGNLEPIRALVLNRQADEWGRSAGVGALMLLAAWAEVPRAPVIDWFLWLAHEGLEREPSAVWDNLAADCADIEALEVFQELRRAYDEELIHPQFMSRSELDAAEAMPHGERVRQTRERHSPIDDVAAATAWWDRRSRDDDDNNDGLVYEDDDADADAGEYVAVAEPYRAPPRVGRNEPCPCGSGRKYKKCCGREFLALHGGPSPAT